MGQEERLTAKQITKQLIQNLTVDNNLKSSEFIKKYWLNYKQNYKNNQNINGKVFEELIALTLIREKIIPFYIQAHVAFIPYVNYDFVLYTEELGPISLSIKTSLRERWKQADLEAIVLKYIHRKARSFVITLDATAVKSRRVDESQALGINAFVLADTHEYDDMLKEIKKLHLISSPTVKVVTSNSLVTSESAQMYV